jgi:protein O-mannosyl-transferase
VTVSAAVPAPVGRLWLPILLCLTLLAYLNGLVGPLQFDDHALETDRAARDWEFWWDSLGRRVRPLLKASYILSRSIGEMLVSIPLGHHLVGLGIHLLAVALAYRVAKDLRSSILVGGASAGGAAAAAACAAVLALHPLGTEAVTYISGRSVALATLFTLGALALHVIGARTEVDGRRALWSVAAAGCCLAAALTREAMIVVPAVLTLWEWSRADAPLAPFSGARLLAALGRTLGYWAVAAAVALWLLTHDRYADLADVSRVIVQGRSAEPTLVAALEYFAQRLFLLAPLGIDPDLAPWRLGLPRRLMLTVALAGTLVWAWRVRRVRPHWLFGLAWILIFLLPVYLVPLRHDAVSERHFYPALFGVGFIAACEGARIASLGVAAGRLVSGCACFLVATMLVATVARNADYESEVALWESAAISSPRKPRVFNNLGVAHMKESRFDLAIPCFERVLVLDPGHRSAEEYLDRARLKHMTGNPEAEPEI